MRTVFSAESPRVSDCYLEPIEYVFVDVLAQPLIRISSMKPAYTPLRSPSPRSIRDPFTSVHHHPINNRISRLVRSPLLVPILTSGFLLLVFLNTVLLTTHLLSPFPSPIDGAFPNRTLFLPHPLYESFNASSDALWDGMQTPNGGFYIQELYVHGRKERHNFGISMFHQLHCLSMIREALGVLERIVERELERDEGGKKWSAVHVGHCVDYVRQGILCAADDTLEPPSLETGLDMISGHGVVHKCRDRDSVWRLSVESGWIDPDVHP